MSESWEFYGKALRAMLGLGVQRAAQQIQAAGHRWTWRNIENAKNVVIIGGSYAGIHLARRLSETLPTGYRAVLVERNSHFNHLFVFPRFGVVPGREQTAFVPYDGIPSFGPRGILRHVRGSVSSFTPTQVRLASGESIDYEYLAIATGTWQPPPSKASSTEKAEACAELRGAQKRIQHANRIAVIGGGPVGIQIATDIASYFPEKSVTLIHSRAQLLPNFGPRLHEHAYKAMQQLKINVILGERPQLDGNGGDAGPGTLSLKDGRTIQYDLVVRLVSLAKTTEKLTKFTDPVYWTTSELGVARRTRPCCSLPNHSADISTPDATDRRPIQSQSPHLRLGGRGQNEWPPDGTRCARSGRCCNVQYPVYDPSGAGID